MRWFKDNAWWILLVLVGVAGFVLAILIRDKDRPSLDQLVNELKLEKKIIDERAAVAKRVAKEDHAKVAAEIKEQYVKDIEKLDEDGKKKVEELSDDPEALVAHLLRLGA